MRVLVVEDDPALSDVLRDFLCELGHEPVVTHSAEEALARMRLELPDAALLDIYLPGISGLDFLQLKATRESRIPIVAISGMAPESQARECVQLGAVDFLPKPIELERLREVLACLEVAMAAEYIDPVDAAIVDTLGRIIGTLANLSR